MAARPASKRSSWRPIDPIQAAGPSSPRSSRISISVGGPTRPGGSPAAGPPPWPLGARRQRLRTLRREAWPEPAHVRRSARLVAGDARVERRGRACRTAAPPRAESSLGSRGTATCRGRPTAARRWPPQSASTRTPAGRRDRRPGAPSARRRPAQLVEQRLPQHPPQRLDRLDGRSGVARAGDRRERARRAAVLGRAGARLGPPIRSSSASERERAKHLRAQRAAPRAQAPRAEARRSARAGARGSARSPSAGPAPRHARAARRPARSATGSRARTRRACGIARSPSLNISTPGRARRCPRLAEALAPGSLMVSASEAHSRHDRCASPSARSSRSRWPC